MIQPRPQAFIRYRVTGEFSCRARRVTSHLITRRGRLGTRLVITSKKGRQGGKGYRQSEGMMDRQTDRQTDRNRRTSQLFCSR